MDKQELIITTAKEMFLKAYYTDTKISTFEQDLSNLDKSFKAIAKTVTDAYLESEKAK